MIILLNLTILIKFKNLLDHKNVQKRGLAKLWNFLYALTGKKMCRRGGGNFNFPLLGLAKKRRKETEKE